SPDSATRGRRTRVRVAFGKCFRGWGYPYPPIPSSPDEAALLYVNPAESRSLLVQVRRGDDRVAREDHGRGAVGPRRRETRTEEETDDPVEVSMPSRHRRPQTRRH